jgi:hypothetical protein
MSRVVLLLADRKERERREGEEGRGERERERMSTRQFYFTINDKAKPSALIVQLSISNFVPNTDPMLDSKTCQPRHTSLILRYRKTFEP